MPPKMMFLPPAEGSCRICAVVHEPTMAHNFESLFYQMRFRARYGRDPTWADAIAHCPDAQKSFIKSYLLERDAWNEPKDAEPISEPIDG